MTKEDEVILQKVEEAYNFYANELKQMIDMVEMHYDAIPAGMLAEIRSMTGHMCDAIIRKDTDVHHRLENVTSAITHMRRIYLDCYKLMCIWSRKYIKDFSKKYYFIDWQNITDGDFIRELSRLKKAAKVNYNEAKKVERPGKNDRDKEGNLGEVYSKYEDAFNAYMEVVDYIENNLDRVERSAHNDRRKKFFSALGWIIGIALTIVFGIMSLA